MVSEISKVALIILAAGASRRMGVPKQLLKWGDTTLLGHTINVALQIKDCEVILVLGSNYNLIKKEVESYPITILNNKEWNQGLGESIACAAKYIIKSKQKFDRILIALADQPLVDVSLFENLLKEFQSESKQIVATSYGDNKNGVPVVFDYSYLEELSILSSDRGAKNLLEKHKTKVRAVMGNNYNVDLDTKQDYEQLYNIIFDKKT